MTMYRPALEQIPSEQGYGGVRMLGPKLAAIAKDQNAPLWYRDLDPDSWTS